MTSATMPIPSGGVSRITDTPESRAQAAAEFVRRYRWLFLLGVIVAPTLGATLGGWITDNYTWNWCFFINVPIGIASVFLVTGFLRDLPDQAKSTGEVDWSGITLLTLGIGNLQYVLEEGNAKDSFEDGRIVRRVILTAVSLLGMFWWELHPKNTHPVSNFRVIKTRALSASLFLFVLVVFALVSPSILILRKPTKGAAPPRAVH